MSQQYKAHSWQSIFDVLTDLSIPLENTVSILQQNGYDLETDFYSNYPVVITYDQALISEPTGGQPVKNVSVESQSYTTNSNQNIFDIVLMTVGDLNKSMLLISQNNNKINSINDDPLDVITINYNTSDITDNGFKSALKKSNINISTGAIQRGGFILLEDAGFLLQENGYRLFIE